jgi:hypothetical protein
MSGFDPTELVSHLPAHLGALQGVRRRAAAGPGELDNDPNFWRSRRVVVTGGVGFLGSHLVARLAQRGCTDILVPRRAAVEAFLSGGCGIRVTVQGGSTRRSHRGRAPQTTIAAATKERYLAAVRALTPVALCPGAPDHGGLRTPQAVTNGEFGR